MLLLAETAQRLSNEIANLSSEIDNAKWAFGIIITVIIAYGVGAGLTLIKISDNQIKRIEKDLDEKFDQKMEDLPLNTKEEKVKTGVVTLNNWKLVDPSNDPLSITTHSNLIIYSINTIVSNDNYNDMYKEFAVIPSNVQIDEGYYQAYESKSNKWVTIRLIKNRLYLIDNLHLKQVKLYIKIFGYSISA